MNPKKISWIFIVFGAGFILYGGLFFHHSIQKTLFINSHRLAVSKLQALTFEVNQGIRQLKTAVSMASDSESARNALISPSTQKVAETNGLCDTVSKSLYPSTVFIMNAEGKVVASSNREEPQSFLGKNYSFRPYFKTALAGQVNVYLAFGVTSHKKGFYFAAPIFAEGEVVGVFVVKRSLLLIDEELAKFASTGSICLVSPEMIIFASTNSSWQFKTLEPLSPPNLQELVERRQFGLGPFDWVGLKREENPHPYAPHSFVYRGPEGQMYARHDALLSEVPGWKFILYHDVQKTEDTLVAPMAANALYALAPGLILVFLVSLFLFSSLMKALNQEQRLLEQLKRKIAEIKTLRGILPICCYCKKIRTDEDAWHSMEAYVTQHSDAEFSHGVCPECMEAYLGEDDT